MKDSFSITPDNETNNRNDDNRLLQKLRLALIFWFVSLLITIYWFSNSPAF